MRSMRFIACRRSVKVRRRHQCGPGRQLWTGMRVGVTAYLLQGPPITENKSQRIERIERIMQLEVLAAIALVCAQEGVGLVVHFPLEDVARINTP
jgi:hypothetical protein